jgi:hypothetical protein
MKLNALVIAVAGFVCATASLQAQTTGKGTLVYAGTISWIDVSNRVITVDGKDCLRNRAGVLSNAPASSRKYENVQSTATYAPASGSRDFAVPQLCSIIFCLEATSKKIPFDKLETGQPVEIEYMKSVGEGWRVTAIIIRNPIPDPQAANQKKQ